MHGISLKSQCDQDKTTDGQRTLARQSPAEGDPPAALAPQRGEPPHSSVLQMHTDDLSVLICVHLWFQILEHVCKRTIDY